MGRINWGTVIVGGLLGGLIINAVEFLVNNVLLQKQWATAMAALGRPDAGGDRTSAKAAFKGYGRPGARRPDDEAGWPRVH
jgi:hypothetical protein